MWGSINTAHSALHMPTLKLCDSYMVGLEWEIWNTSDFAHWECFLILHCMTSKSQGLDSLGMWWHCRYSCICFCRYMNCSRTEIRTLNKPVHLWILSFLHLSMGMILFTHTAAVMIKWSNALSAWQKSVLTEHSLNGNYYFFLTFILISGVQVWFVT